MTQPNDSPDALNILLTGGSGFLGKAIVNELLDADSPVKVGRLVVFDCKPFDYSADTRVTFIKGDVCNPHEIEDACKGMDMVIHAAAIVDWGTKSPKEVYRTNFTGTQHVISSCKKHNVRMLVFISSLDTVITGQPLVNIDESQPYPVKHLNMYCESKCLAERMVLEENSVSMKTIVLRPSDIWGEDDPYHIPPLINMAKSGFYVRIGDGTARSQHVYVRNMAWATVLAAKALVDDNATVKGKAYFITDGPGDNFFTFFDDIVMQAGYKIWPRNLWLPKKFTYSLGAMAEYFAFAIRPVKYYVPKLSRFAVMYTSTDFTFSADKARRDFGFSPKYNHEEAMENTIAFFRKK